jgi:hypothetical protein
MTAVTVVSEVSSCPALLAATGIGALGEGTALEIGDAFDEGFFGTVHRCDRLNGAPSPPLVVKLLTGGGEVDPSSNLRVVADLHAAIDRARPLPPEWERRLQGAPLWAGEVESAGTRVPAVIAKDLTAAGYEPFKDVFDDVRKWDRFALGLTVLDRVRLAESFATAYVILERLGFLHGDVNRENLFVNLSTIDVQLIDFDSGVVQVTGDERPLTLGKADDFVAPEAISETMVHRAKLNRAAELWSVGVMIHYLIAASTPFFFLRNVSLKGIERYLREYRWPDIAADSDLLTPHKQNRDFYTYYLKGIVVPAEIRHAFAVLVNEGALDPERRPSGATWAGTLAARTLPEFEFVLLVDDAVAAGAEATVRWLARNADEVTVSGVAGSFPADGSAAVPMERTGRIHLVARNLFGTAEATTDLVRVFAVPTIGFIALPAPRPLHIVTRMTVPAPPDARRSVERLADAVSTGLGDRLHVSLAPVPQRAGGSLSSGRFGAGPPPAPRPLAAETLASAHLLSEATARPRLPKLWLSPLAMLRSRAAAGSFLPRRRRHEA